MIDRIRQLIDHEEFDYQALMSALSGYASPRSRVTALLRSGAIIRVKKGLYIFGDAYRRRPYCRELLANLIYGPSFVSMDYALAYYGLIPERVEEITSVTSGRSRSFQTPIGLFSYTTSRHLAVGVRQEQYHDTQFLIAVPERALADRLHHDRRGVLRTFADMEAYLLNDLRLDRNALDRMNTDLLDELGQTLRSHKIRLCSRLLSKWRTTR